MPTVPGARVQAVCECLVTKWKIRYNKHDYPIVLDFSGVLDQGVKEVEESC